jgi:hypothetical protein
MNNPRALRSLGLELGLVLAPLLCAAHAWLSW